MRKKETVSLKPIVREIEKVQKALVQAKVRTRSGELKETLRVKIQKLNKIIAEVKMTCPKGKSAYNVVVNED